MESKDLIKDRILQSATKLMNQFGYGALSLSEVARHAEITKQRLYYHFKHPEDIIVQLAKSWGQSGQAFTVRALAETHEIGPYKVITMNSAVFNWLKHDYDLARLGLVIFQSAPHIPQLSGLMDVIRKTGLDRIKSLLLQDERFKKMSKDKLDNIATSLHSQMYGYYFYVVTTNDFKNLDSQEKNANETLRKLIDSYLQ